MRIRKIILGCLTLAVVSVAAFGILNRKSLWNYYQAVNYTSSDGTTIRDTFNLASIGEAIFDILRAVNYTPSSEMVTIRDNLDLTDAGEVIFDVSQPVLDDQDDFNAHCQTLSNEAAVLGCYTDRTIYVYNIASTELSGIKEVTTAHELLHAVYARMSEAEKTSLQEVLEQVYEDNVAILQDDLSLYSDADRIEEIYVRAGTEVVNLPDVLEQNYARIFKDQDKIANYYNGYNSVFRELEEELNTLLTEIEELSSQIDQKKTAYEINASQLETEIQEFNNCAKTTGCFADEIDFDNRRAEIVAQQEVLKVNYDEIANLVNTYNVKVKAYNADVLRSNELNTMINSNQSPSELDI